MSLAHMTPQERWARKQKENGKCSRCTRPRNLYKWLCDRCQAKASLYMQRYRAALRKAEDTRQRELRKA